jgi:hypothetical protein
VHEKKDLKRMKEYHRTQKREGRNENRDRVPVRLCDGKLEREGKGAVCWVQRFRLYIFFASKQKNRLFSLSFALSEYEWCTLGAPFSFTYFFRFKAKKIAYFSLSFALSEYERRTLGAPISLIYFFRFKAKKNPLFFA